MWCSKVIDYQQTQRAPPMIKNSIATREQFFSSFELIPYQPPLYADRHCTPTAPLHSFSDCSISNYYIFISAPRTEDFVKTLSVIVRRSRFILKVVLLFYGRVAFQRLYLWQTCTGFCSSCNYTFLVLLFFFLWLLRRLYFNTKLLAPLATRGAGLLE